eukprot:5522468-Pleurochrysis_carterae.AAC.1
MRGVMRRPPWRRRRLPRAARRGWSWGCATRRRRRRRRPWPRRVASAAASSRPDRSALSRGRRRRPGAPTERGTRPWAGARTDGVGGR